MSKLLAFPWSKVADNYTTRRSQIYDQLGNLVAVCFQTADELFCYRIYNRDFANNGHINVINDEKYGYVSLVSARKACDIKLVELGYELISKERTRKLMLLL